ncbi:MAG: hypothetical protein JHC30_05885, partial [Caldisericum sp.]|nr:hypothetical protein [Caldisericum sp.]
TYTPPATVYIALFTVAPTDAGGGTEVSGGGYARVAVANNSTNFPPATNGQKSNGTAIIFPTATADWGTIVAVGIYDAATNGNLLFWANLTTARTVQSGDTAQFAVGALTFTED